MERLNLEYLRPQSGRRYSYYSIPKLLFDHPAFDGLDYGAKILYAVALSKASLSAEHADKYTDKLGRLYIIYTLEEITQDLRCGKGTAMKLLKQLTEIGLIEKKRQGQGKPALIYVMDFASVEEIEYASAPPPVEPVQETKGNPAFSTDEEKGGNAENFRSPKNGHQEVRKKDIKKSKKWTPRGLKNGPLEVQNLDPRYNDLSYLDLSYLDLIHQSGQIDADGLEELTENIRDQIESEVLSAEYGQERAEEVVRLLVDTFCRSEELRIGKGRYPPALVRHRLEELTCEHVRFALDSIDRGDTVIRNPRGYLLTTLFNAPTSMETALAAQVERDRKQEGRKCWSG